MNKNKRDVLKGLAVGSVWATPVVSSVVLPLHAATSPEPPCDSIIFNVSETLLGAVECKDIGFIGYYWVEWLDGCPVTNSGPSSPGDINALVIKVDDNGGSQSDFQVLIEDENDSGSLVSDQKCDDSNPQDQPNSAVYTEDGEDVDQGSGITYKWSATLTGGINGNNGTISVSDITLTDIVNSNA